MFLNKIDLKNMQQLLNLYKINNFMELLLNYIKIFNKCLKKLCQKNNHKLLEFYYFYERIYY
jgi:hypothetical protein